MSRTSAFRTCPVSNNTMGPNVYFDKTNQNYKVKFFRNGRQCNVTGTKDLNRANVLGTLIEATKAGVVTEHNLLNVFLRFDENFGMPDSSTDR